MDLLVANAVIGEIKAVEKHNPVWNAQLLSYLKLTRRRLGFLINFNVPVIKDGIKRMIV
jgi:GxxExxY protein